MFKSSQGHIRFRDLDCGLVLFLLSFFSATQLLWHDWGHLLKSLKFFLSDYCIFFVKGKVGHTVTFGLFNTSFQCWFVYLLVQRGVISTFSVDVVGEQGLAIIYTAHSWIGIRSAICMEGWLSEIRGEGGVRKPSCCVKEN
jgi:hypothetical protein